MYRNGGIWIHVEQGRLNDIDHLIAPRRIDCDLEVRDDDSEVPSKTAKQQRKALQNKTDDTDTQGQQHSERIKPLKSYKENNYQDMLSLK